MAKASDDAEKEVFGTLRYITSYEWLDSIWYPNSSGRRYVSEKKKKYYNVLKIFGQTNTV